jgi:hypothetical protein
MARRFSWWWKPVSIVLLALIVVRGGACGACAGAGRPDPDERLGHHFERLCKVAEKGIADPKDGVRKMMRYYGDHGPDMLESFGATLVMIERIDDDAAHDRRARQARSRIQAPIIACDETWMEFAEAVEADPEASAILERGVDRLARTLEILFGESEGAGLPLIDPRAMMLRFDVAR